MDSSAETAMLRDPTENAIAMYLLLVEDDLDLGQALLKLLGQHYRVDWLRTLTAARSHGDAFDYDLIVLDLGLPDGDGGAWIDELRAAGASVPVLILSARDALTARVDGLERGADDYLVKPFEPAELLARIRVLLRRQAGSAAPRLQCGALSLDVETRSCYLHDTLLALTPSEYRILACLLQAGAKPVSRERLLAVLYGSGNSSDSNTLEVHVHALRRRLGRAAIETVRGFGYRLSPP